MFGATVGVTSGPSAFHVGLVLTAFAFGFRHGIDWDHIAALTDITGSQDESRQSMTFATLYALGHALVVFMLGFAAIVLAARLPPSVDGVMEHLVGITLIVLAFYVFYAVVRHGRAFRMRSRWMLLFGAVQRGARRLQARTRNVLVVEHEHEHSLEEAHADAHPATVGGGVAGTRTGATHSHRHQHVGTMPDDPFGQYGRRSSFLVGMLHGFGAETPTQVLIFVAAAGAGGSAVGVLLLCCFLVGLVTSNTLVAAAGTFGFLSASHNFPLYVVVSLLTASFSLVIGVVFLLGRATVLPAFFGG